MSRLPLLIVSCAQKAIFCSRRLYREKLQIPLFQRGTLIPPFEKGGQGGFSFSGATHLWFMNVYRESPGLGASFKPAPTGAFISGGGQKVAINV